MPETKKPDDALGVSPSERSRSSFDKAVAGATKAIEEARAQIARSNALSQSEAAQSHEIDRLNEEHGRFLRDQEDHQQVRQGS